MLKKIFLLILNLFFPEETKPKEDKPKEIDRTPPWMSELLKVRGLHERKDFNKLSDWLKSGGKYVNPKTTPWCGDAVETAMVLALPKEKVPGNPMASINWLKFGREQKEPTYGSVMVFWRGNKNNWQGHVAFYVSEDKDYYHVLGGNQSDMISVTKVSKKRLRPHGIRWPLTYPLPNTGKIESDGSGIEVTDNEA